MRVFISMLFEKAEKRTFSSSTVSWTEFSLEIVSAFISLWISGLNRFEGGQ